MGRCWDARGLEKVEASSKWDQKKTPLQMNSGPRGLEKGGGGGGGECRQAAKALRASAGTALPQWAHGQAQRFLEKHRRGGTPALLLLKLPAALGVPLPSALVLCGHFCDMAMLSPSCKSPWMGLAEPGGWQLLASPWPSWHV